MKAPYFGNEVHAAIWITEYTGLSYSERTCVGHGWELCRNRRANHNSCPATADWDAWTDWRINLFLTAGINQIAFEAFTGNEWDAIHLRSIELTPGTGWTSSYEAEATQNTLRGSRGHYG